MQESQALISNAAKNFDILTTSLSILHNYFDGPIKLFRSVSKLLGTSAKPFRVYLSIVISLSLFPFFPLPPSSLSSLLQ